MDIRVMSDLHIELFDFKPIEVPADVVVLAGDILTEHYGLVWGRKAFPNTPIVYESHPRTRAAAGGSVVPRPYALLLRLRG